MTRLIAALLAFVLLLAFDVRFPIDPNSELAFSSATADEDDDDDDDDGDDGDQDTDNAGTSQSSSSNNNASGARSGNSGKTAPFLAPLRRFFGSREPRRAAPNRQRPQTSPPLLQFASGEIIVLNLNAEDLQSLLSDGFRILEERTVPGSQRKYYRLGVPASLSLPEARDAVRSLPSGVNTDFNHFYRPGLGGAECRGQNCTAMKLVNWPVWEPGSANSCAEIAPIGMVDTGINQRHDVFKNANLEVIRLLDEELPASKAVHGTAVASLLVGQPGSRVHGLVPRAELIAIDAFHRAGRDERADAFTLVDALYRLASEKVGVINLSLAGPENSVVATAVADLVQSRGIAIVAAVGNSGPSAAPAFPAALPDVLAITAIDSNKKAYRRSNRGSYVDLAAPGVNVWTAASIKGAKWKTGTSFAVPFGTAAVALAMARHPNLPPAEIYALIKSKAEDLGVAGPDDVYGAGLLSAQDLC